VVELDIGSERGPRGRSGEAAVAGPVLGSAVAPGRSWISGLRSSTSNTRSKLTSAVITSTCTFDSAVIGPYILLSRAASATSAPRLMEPLMTRLPPRP
jgi:hypothetical protein